MSNQRSGSIYLNKRQLEFLVRIMEMPDPRDAIERFAVILVEERIDPSQMNQYLDKLMEREGPTK